MKNSGIPEVLSGRMPLARPFKPMPGQCLLRLPQNSPESKEDAVGRAMKTSWWPRVINPEPRLFGGYWVWLGRKESK